ncbi:hypothetical protein TWF481_002950 [Arthrobotrys musiformis]|uniref:Uncharacterized protein n=1 Tax=Arthrobotrys musiformis TaxID=47236 RepID=A0AAV9VRQ8_9PEZI
MGDIWAKITFSPRSPWGREVNICHSIRTLPIHRKTPIQVKCPGPGLFTNISTAILLSVHVSITSALSPTDAVDFN